MTLLKLMEISKNLKKNLEDAIDKMEFENENFENETFYMCKSINKYTIESLVNKGVYKNNPMNFNDPFDPYFKMIQSKYSDIIDPLNKIKITCFSKQSENLLLWAHYGDSHKGICLGYTISKPANKVYFGEIKYEDLKTEREPQFIVTQPLTQDNIDNIDYNNTSSKYKIKEDIYLTDFYFRKIKIGNMKMNID